MRTHSPLDTAAEYARCGMSVIPWRYIDDDATGKPSKRPAVKWKAMQDDPWSVGQARDWWSANPSDNVGIITGASSGVIVVDCDDDDAVAWADTHLPDTDWRVTTGRGVQMGYRTPADGKRVGNRAKIGGMELDLRGDGGYVSMPPSLHRSGVVYSWQRGPQHHAVVWLPRFDPAWLPSEPTPEPRIPPPWSGTTDATRRAESWMRHREPSVEGGGGHTHAVKTAWALAQMGLDFQDAWPLFDAWNQTCQPPFAERELASMLLTATSK